MPPKKAPQFIPENCKQCRFFLQENLREDVGYCRRRPPGFVFYDSEEDMPIFSFPVVGELEWCGDFQPVSN